MDRLQHDPAAGKTLRGDELMAFLGGIAELVAPGRRWMPLAAVSKDQIKTEFNLFGEIWNIYKAYYTPEAKDNEEYWDSLIEAITAVQHKYPGQLSRDLALAILGDIERRSEERKT